MYQEYYNYIISNIDLDNIKRHVVYFSSLESRYTGYPGSAKAALYIYNYLKNELGLNVTLQNYNVLVPYDNNSSLTLLTPVKRKFRVFALEPNMIDAMDVEIKGELVYLSRGELSKLRSVDLSGKIVLLDFNSGGNWLILKDLGIRAVIFIEPQNTTLRECMLKTMRIPIRYPRALLRAEDAKVLLEILKKQRVYVKLDLNMYWKSINVTNIIAVIPGTEEKIPGFEEDIVLVVAHYDTKSIVPAISPGANDATSIAALLEFARIISNSKPTRTTVIAALSGAAVSMAGARILLREKLHQIGFYERIKRFISFAFDFSTHSSLLLALAQGDFYGPFDWEHVPGPMKESMLKLSHYIADTIGRYDAAMRTYIVHGREYHMSILPSLHGGIARIGAEHLAEVFNRAGIPSLTFYTIRKGNYPLIDTLDNVNFSKLLPQLEVVYYIVYSIIKDPTTAVKDMYTHVWNWGLSELIGRITYLNRTTVNLKALGDRYVAIAYIEHTANFKNFFLVKVERGGTFRVFGLKRQLGRNIIYRVSIFVIDNGSSRIFYTNVKGENVKTVYYARTLYINCTLFECGTIVVSGVFLDTNTFYPIDVKENLDLKVLRIDTREELTTYNTYIPPTLMELLEPIKYNPLAFRIVVVVPCEVGLDVIMTTKTGELVALLEDITLDKGAYIEVPPWNVGEEILECTKSMLTPIVEEPTLRGSIGVVIGYRERALEVYEYLLGNFSKGDYSCIPTLTYCILHYARRAYSILRDIYDSITTMNIVLLFLLLPFAIIVGEMVTGGRGGKKALCTLLIALLTLLLLMLLHPGFKVHPNPIFLFLSTLTLMTTSTSVVILILENYGTLMELRRRIIGEHFIELSRLDVAVASMNTSVRNMRKRRARTLLTIITVILMTISITLLTSWRLGDIVILRFLYEKPPYGGVLVRKVPDGSSLPYFLVDYISGFVGDVSRVYPRAALSGSTILCVRTGKRMSVGRSIVGLMPDDPIALQRALIEGTWFKHSRAGAVVISKDLKEALSVEIGDTILLGSRKLIVVGVISNDIFRELKGIDGALVTPFYMTRGGIIQEDKFLVILPFDTLIEMGGTVISILIPLKESPYTLAVMISRQLSGNYRVYYSNGKSSYMMISIRGYKIRGFESLIVPFLLVSLILSSTMLGSLYERRKEISTYASLGLAPTHIALMTITEGLMYSIIGVVAGYIIASSTGTIVQLLGFDIPMDMSSPHLPLAFLLSILAVVLSCTYPALKISKSVTPSLRRRWEITTTPRGNRWYIPLPFRVSSHREGWGMMRYLAEYFQKKYTGEFEVLEAPNMEERAEKRLVLRLSVMLAPRDVAVSEYVEIIATPTKSGKMIFGVYSELRTGKRYMWITLHRKFVDHIRKQMLLWRTLDPGMKLKYMYN